MQSAWKECTGAIAAFTKGLEILKILNDVKKMSAFRMPAIFSNRAMTNFFKKNVHLNMGKLTFVGVIDRTMEIMLVQNLWSGGRRGARSVSLHNVFSCLPHPHLLREFDQCLYIR